MILKDAIQSEEPATDVNPVQVQEDPQIDMFPATRLIALNDIHIQARKRLVDANWAAALAQDFGTIGQIQSITVRPDAQPDTFILVAGAHRLEAARLLGWTQIMATIRPMDDVEAAIIEIDENLIRNELSALDEALSLAERKALWEQKYPETANGKAKKPKGKQSDGKNVNITFFPQAFTKEAAKATGMSASAIQKACKLAADLTPELIATLRTSAIADNAAQLKAFVAADMPDDEKLNAAKAIAEGKARNFKQALDVIGRGVPLVPQNCFIKLMYFWDRATKRERRDFEAYIGVGGAADGGDVSEPA